MPATSPTFAHAPGYFAASCERKPYAMIAYGGERFGYELEPLEYVYRCRSDAGAIERCRFEAAWQHRKFVKVRDPYGRVIYDGPAGDDALPPCQDAHVAPRVAA